MTTTTSGVPTNESWITDWRNTRHPDRISAITAMTQGPTTGSAETNPPGESPELKARTTNTSSRWQCRSHNASQTPRIRAGVEGVAL
jgi:hypothetical protein